VTAQDDDDLGIVRYGRGIPPAGESTVDGKGLFESIVNRTPLRPIREVRTNLDVVPGGHMVGEITGILLSRMVAEGAGVALSLARVLQPIAHWYDEIIFDSAPENDSLEQLAAGAARWLIVPTRSDNSSIKGLRRIARNYKMVRSQVNPHLRVAGAVLYASNPSATQMHNEVKESIREILGDSAPILSTVVGYRERPAVESRKFGVTFGEYAAALTRGDSPFGIARRAQATADSSVGLARDMEMLITEIRRCCGGTF
jgi:cellulose biosynthesis protein BcsQ